MGFFEEIEKQLEAMDANTEARPLHVALDDAGYLDRQCPAARCARGFKVLWADAGKFARHTWCTYCGHQETHDSFSTAEQRVSLAAVVQEHAAQAFHAAMTAAARKVNASSSEERVQVPPRTPRELVIPTAWELMKVSASCDSCGCGFAGLGSICFCPACGHRSPELTFEQTVRRLRVSLAKRSELEAAIGRDAAADIMAAVLEDGMRVLVTVFESFAKDSYARLMPTAAAPAKGTFQRLQQASDVWHGGGGRPFDAVLSRLESADLGRYFQQRHVVVHRNGFVDAEYLLHTQDQSYREGQRLSIRAADVERMLDLVEKLVDAMRIDLPL